MYGCKNRPRKSEGDRVHNKQMRSQTYKSNKGRVSRMYTKVQLDKLGDLRKENENGNERMVG